MPPPPCRARVNSLSLRTVEGGAPSDDRGRLSDQRVERLVLVLLGKADGDDEFVQLHSPTQPEQRQVIVEAVNLPRTPAVDDGNGRPLICREHQRLMTVTVSRQLCYTNHYDFDD